MRSPGLLQTRAAVPAALLCLALSGGIAGCSSAEGSGDASLVVEVLQDEITLENKTGSSLAKGEISIIPMGFGRPFVANITYMTSGSKKSFPMNSFRAPDGSKFARDVGSAKAVKVSAKDPVGKTFEREVPFK